MKKLLIGTLALFLSLHATAESNTVSTEKLPIEKLSKEVAVFYKNPSDTRAVNLLDSLVKADLMRHTTIVWASQVLQKYPQVSTAWCNKIRTYHDNAQTFTTYTLAMTGTPQAQTCINSLTLDAALKKWNRTNRNLSSTSRTYGFSCITIFSMGNLLCNR